MKLDNVIAKRPTKTIYRDGNLCIKLFDESYLASDILNETHNLAIVHESGFPAPALIGVERIDGKWAIITEYIEGKALAEYIKDNPVREDEYFERLVDIQLRLHQYSASRLRRLTDKMQDKISKCGLSATVRYELHTRLDALPKHNKLCHGDFTPGNVIITPNNDFYVIDWAHATQGNASADAARTYLRFRLAGNDEQAEKYLDYFCRKSDTAKQNVQKWLSIVAASQLVKDNPLEQELLTQWTNVVEYQ